LHKEEFVATPGENVRPTKIAMPVVLQKVAEHATYKIGWNNAEQTPRALHIALIMRPQVLSETITPLQPHIKGEQKMGSLLWKMALEEHVDLRRTPLSVTSSAEVFRQTSRDLFGASSMFLER
jgi:hypothetical protein